MPPKPRALNENQLRVNEEFIKRSLTARELTYLNRLSKTNRDILLRQILNRIVFNLGGNAGEFFTRLSRYAKIKYENARPDENEIGELERELKDVYKGVASEAIGDTEEFIFDRYYDDSVPHVKPISSKSLEWKLHKKQKEPAIAEAIEHPWNDTVSIANEYTGVINQFNPFNRQMVPLTAARPVSINNRPGSYNEEYLQDPEIYEQLDPEDYGRIRAINEEDYNRQLTTKERQEILRRERERQERLRREFEIRLRERQEREQMGNEDKTGSGRSKQNKWIIHVKKIQKKHNITYKNALKLASKTYK